MGLRSFRVMLGAVVVLAGGAAAVGCGAAATPASTASANGVSTAASTATPRPAATPTRTTSPRASGSARPKPAKTAATVIAVAQTSTAAAARIVYVDVGQGDAEIVKSGSWTGLIDGGPSGAAYAVESALGRLGVKRLDAVVATHMHADHIGGLVDVVYDLRPRRAYVAGPVKSALATAFARAGTVVRQVRRGASLHFGALPAKVLSPAGISGDPNSDSVVILLQAGGKRFLFTGDVTGPNEAAVGAQLARGPPLAVLKVAHHGSAYSTTAAFLSQARPRFAVIEVGHNSYGHPSAATIARLHAAGARIYDTLKNGTITLSVSAAGTLTWAFSRTSAPVTSGVGSASDGSASGGGSSGSSGASAGAAAAAGTSSGGDPTVYVTATGACYHRSGCRYLSESRIPIKLKDAKARGYRPCSVCDPPQ
ncbi:MAG TPA: ComEC/Rec2 family competence protein [Thermoleophilia bacterium]|nr:ComEC/Rec2 family competence protein [Thermoleophilia bacterium]